MGKAARDDSPGKADPPLSVSIEAGKSIVVDIATGWAEGQFRQAREELLRKLDGDGADLPVHIRVGKSAPPGDSLAAGVLELVRMAEKRGARVDLSDLPENLRKMIGLARATPEKHESPAPLPGRIERVGIKAVEVLQQCRLFIEFLGELVYSTGRLLTGRARYRKRDFWVTIEDCSVGALPIVGLLALLTGTILGFVGAVQLRKFGATIYMTDLVGLAMAREMGCLMTGIIMSGRTGAAFAAQIGTMKVNQEIDALRTFGFSPVEFLVVPRALSLFLMMPLLTLFANVLGWTGGFLVALPMGINPAEYWIQLTDSLTVNHILFGLSKSFFFGIVIAISGCYYGLIAKRNSAAVGQAATRAVVAGITWIVILDAVFAFMDEVLAW